MGLLPMRNESDYNGEMTLRVWTQSSAFGMAILLCVVIGAFLSVSHISKRVAPCVVVVEDRINPNEAPAASLVRLPGIGPSKAAAIIRYRLDTGREIAFKTGADMENVDGIGPATVRKIEPYLYFERAD